MVSLATVGKPARESTFGSIGRKLTYKFIKAPTLSRQELADEAEKQIASIELSGKRSGRTRDPQTMNEKLNDFLFHYARCKKMWLAAVRAQIGITTIENRRKNDPAFRRAVLDAASEFKERLETVMLQRAIVGTERKMWTASGKPIIDPDTGKQATYRIPSDLLLLSAIKKEIPEYRNQPKQDQGQSGPVSFSLSIGSKTVNMVQTEPKKIELIDAPQLPAPTPPAADAIGKEVTGTPG